MFECVRLSGRAVTAPVGALLPPFSRVGHLVDLFGLDTFNHQISAPIQMPPRLTTSLMVHSSAGGLKPRSLNVTSSGLKGRSATTTAQRCENVGKRRYGAPHASSASTFLNDSKAQEEHDTAQHGKVLAPEGGPLLQVSDGRDVVEGCAPSRGRSIDGDRADMAHHREVLELQRAEASRQAAITDRLDSAVASMSHLVGAGEKCVVELQLLTATAAECRKHQDGRDAAMARQIELDDQLSAAKAEIVHHRNALSEAHLSWTTEGARLAAALAARDAAITRLEAEATAVQTLLDAGRGEVDRMTTLLENATRNRDRLSQSLTAVAAERDALVNDFAEMAAERSRKSAELRDLRGASEVTISELNASVAGLQQRVDDLSGSLQESAAKSIDQEVNHRRFIESATKARALSKEVATLVADRDLWMAKCMNAQNELCALRREPTAPALVEPVAECGKASSSIGAVTGDAALLPRATQVVLLPATVAQIPSSSSSDTVGRKRLRTLEEVRRDVRAARGALSAEGRAAMDSCLMEAPSILVADTATHR